MRGLRVQVVLHALAWAFPVWVGAASTLPPAACSHCKLWLKTAIRAKLQKEKGEKKENRKKKKSTYLGPVQEAHLPDNPSLRPTAVYTYLRCSRCRTKGSRSPAPAASTPARAAPGSAADARQQMLGGRPQGAEGPCREHPLPWAPPGRLRKQLVLGRLCWLLLLRLGWGMSRLHLRLLPPALTGTGHAAGPAAPDTRSPLLLLEHRLVFTHLLWLYFKRLMRLWALLCPRSTTLWTSPLGNKQCDTQRPGDPAVPHSETAISSSPARWHSACFGGLLLHRLLKHLFLHQVLLVVLL